MYTAAGPRTVARTLRGAFAVPLVCLLLAGVAGTVALGMTVRGFEAYAHHEAPLLSINDDLLQALTDAETAERGFLVTGQSRFLAPYEPAKAEFERLLTAARERAGSEQLEALFVQQGEAGRTWFEEFGDPIVALHPEDPAAAVALSASGVGRGLFDEFRATNLRTERAVRSRLDAQLRAARTTAATAALLFVALIGVAVIGGARVAMRASQAITSPLEALEGVLQRLRTGDYEARIEPSGPAELVTVGGAVNELADAAKGLRDTQDGRLELGRQITLATTSLHSVLEVDHVLQVAVDTLGPALGDRAIARRVSSEVHGIHAEWCADGVASFGEDPTATYPQGLHRLIQEAASERRALHITDVIEDPRLDAASKDFLLAADTCSFLATAVRLGWDETFIVAIHATMLPRLWDELEVALFEAVLREVGTATTNAVAFADQGRLVERLEQLDRDKTDFMSNISHELRTPLTSIMGYLELLADGDGGALNEEQLELVATVDRNSRRLLDLIEDLLILSRIEGGTFTMVEEPIDLAHVAREVAAALVPLYRSRPVQLLLELPAEPVTVMGDGRQLERVLLNLLNNAAKFTPPHGTVRFTVSREAEQVEVVVADTGIGVPVAEQQRLFERFFRSSTARDRAIQGTGLGLAITKTIVERHGGHIHVESVLDVGTTFVVRLPTHPDVKDEREIACPAATRSS